MFERYTEKARRVIFFARYEASQFGAPAIEPEHVLLGLMREDKKLLGRFFPRVNISIESIREEIKTRTLLRKKISTSVELPLAPETKRVLAYAHEESESLRHRHIGTEHMLLGLLCEERSMAAEILYERGLRLNSIRTEIALLSQEGFDIVQEALRQHSVSLDLSQRGLVDVPSSVSQLTWLQRLDLSGNRLNSLPEFIGQLSQLEYLNVSNNLLSSLPDSLLSLRALEALYLHGNEALNLPVEILGPPDRDDVKPEHPARVLEYYYRVNSPEGQRSLNEAKLILVGRGSVGKTSLINRLLFNVFRPEKRTEGIQITKWNLRLKGNELIRLNVWDFGGQEILHATSVLSHATQSLSSRPHRA